MTLPSLFRYQAFDDSGRPVPGALVSFRQGSRPGPVFLDPELRTEARNPFPAKAGGRVTLYLHAGESYDVTITSPRGQILDQFVHTGQAIGETVTETVVVPETVEVEKVVYQTDPDILEELQRLRTGQAEAAKAAMMANLEKLEAADAKLKERPAKPNPDDMFDTNLLKDLIRENEPHADAQRRWQSDYNQLLNRLVDSRLPPLSPTEREYQRRLQAALYMGRMGAVEIL